MLSVLLFVNRLDLKMGWVAGFAGGFVVSGFGVYAFNRTETVVLSASHCLAMVAYLGG